MAGEDRNGEAEGRDLCQRKIDEDHAASQDVQAEVSVDPREHEARDERPKQQLDHPFSACSSAAASRFTFSSNKLM